MSEQPRKISNFHLIEVMYEGSKCEIYEARYTHSGGVVQGAAVKLLRPQMACIGDELRGFLRELGWTRDLRNSLTPRLIEAGEQGGHYFIAMELIEGFTLAELMRAVAVLQVPLPVQVGLTVAHQIAKGVHRMHEYSEGEQLLGVVHLGIQPENILLRQSGQTVLVDFGATTSDSAGELVDLDDGGEAYHAPERLRMLPVDRRADIYSLGRVIADLSRSMAPQDIGEDLPALIGRATHTHAEERFETMAELALALEQVAANRGVDVSTQACALFTAEIFGQSKGRSDPRSRRQQSQAPVVMRSEGLPTAYASTLKPEISESDDGQSTVLGGSDASGSIDDGMSTVLGKSPATASRALASGKGHRPRSGDDGQSTVMGGPNTPHTGDDGLSTVMGGPDAPRAGDDGQSTVMGGPDAPALNKGPIRLPSTVMRVPHGPRPGDDGQSTVMGGPDAPRPIDDGQSTVMGGPDAPVRYDHGLATVMGGPDAQSESRARGSATAPRTRPEAGDTFGEPEFGNDEPTARNLDTESSSRGTGSKRFVDEHQAVTVMGSPDMLAKLANTEESTDVLEKQARAARGFPEELIPTRSYESSAPASEDEEETEKQPSPHDRKR